MPPGLSPVHLLVIFVVALIVLGPEKGPEAIGKGARLLGEAKQWIARTSEELQSAVSLPTEAPTEPTAEVSPALPGAGADVADTSDRVPADGASPPGGRPVPDVAMAADPVATSSPPGPADADHPPLHEEPHL